MNNTSEAVLLQRGTILGGMKHLRLEQCFQVSKGTGELAALAIKTPNDVRKEAKASKSHISQAPPKLAKNPDTKHSAKHANGATIYGRYQNKGLLPS
jgi:hypothetical protein